MEKIAKTQLSEDGKREDSKQSYNNPLEQETTNQSPHQRESVDISSRVETMSDLSVFSDSDNQYLSSSATSTLKSDLSEFGDHRKRLGAMKNQDAVATLDSFLMDVTENLEKVKKEERIRFEKIQSQEKISPVKVAAPLIRGWRSSSNLFDDKNKRKSFDIQMSHSYDDLKFICVENIPDRFSVPESAPPILYPENKKRTLLSQGNDHGINHLNQLCTWIEKFENLKFVNTKLSNEVSSLNKEKSTNSNLRKASSEKKLTSDSFQPLSLPKKYDFDFTAPKSHKKQLKLTKLKGTHKEKPKFKSRYPAALSLPFVLAAKSVDNLKFGSSQNLYKERVKPKRAEKYSQDDLEIGKSVPGENWRHSSAKKTTAKDSAKATFISEDKIGNRNVTAKETKVSVVGAKVIVVQLDSQTESRVEVPNDYDEKTSVENQTAADVTNTSKPINKKIFPTKQTSPVKVEPKEKQSYRNVKKMTEWGSLQQAFPSQCIETSEQLLNHLDLVINKHRPGKKSSHSSFKKAQWFANKKEKSNSPEIYLPNTEIQGFGSTLLAAQSMANHLTLALSLGDLKALSTTHTQDDKQNIPSAQIIHLP